MSNKRAICCLGINNEYLKKINSVGNNKGPCGIRTRDVQNTRPTNYPFGYEVSYMLTSITLFQ